jgi:hypothetical protein
VDGRLFIILYEIMVRPLDDAHARNLVRLVLYGESGTRSETIVSIDNDANIEKKWVESTITYSHGTPTRDISPAGDASSSSDAGSGTASCRQPMSRTPKIGPAIQHLLLEWGYWDQDIEWQVEISKNILQQASASPKDCERWENALQTGDPDAWLAVLTLSLESVKERLERVTLETDEHDNDAIWGDPCIGFRPRLFYEALCTQKHSLQELPLNNTGDTEACS